MMKNILLIFLCISTYSFAQYTDKDLYEAYLTTDLTLWKKYIDDMAWEDLSQYEKQRMLNYQYGFVANTLGGEKAFAQAQLDLFKNRTEEMRTTLSASTLSCYRSAYAAYQVKLGTWKILKMALQSLDEAKLAVEQDSLNPLALTLKGNVDMYCPKAFGGDKVRALRYFLLAEERYRELGRTENNWNLRALQLCIAQCYEKTGEKEKAIQKCREILQEEPNYAYIRDAYLPRLLGQKPKSNMQKMIDTEDFENIL